MMRRTIVRALIFAGAVTAVSLAVDLLFSVFYQGGPPQGRTREFVVHRSALHGATLVLTAVGGLVGFAFARSYTVANGQVAALGACVGLVTLAALLVAFHYGGFRAMAVWLFLSSIAVSYAGTKLLGTRAVQV